MKFDNKIKIPRIGSLIRIKDLEWYEKNKDKNGFVSLFIYPMTEYLEKEAFIVDIIKIKHGPNRGVTAYKISIDIDKEHWNWPIESFDVIKY